MLELAQFLRCYTSNKTLTREFTITSIFYKWKTLSIMMPRKFIGPPGSLLLFVRTLADSPRAMLMLHAHLSAFKIRKQY